MSLVIFTCAVGLLIAPVKVGFINATLSLIAVALGSGAAGALNMWNESDLDSVMTRTCLRPIPAGKIKREKLVTLVVGGPNKYYDYNDKIINEIFLKIKANFINNGYQLIFIPSMRTPKKIIDKAKSYFDENQIIITNVDKKAYLSSLKIAEQIIVTCDSISMISEAAMTGKPIYVADIPAKKNDFRIKKFNKLFNQLNIIKKLENKLETWHYENLDETSRIAIQIKKKLI